MRRLTVLVVLLLAGCGAQEPALRQVDAHPLYELTTTAPTPSLERADACMSCATSA